MTPEHRMRARAGRLLCRPYTLIELMIVVAIIGILALITIPNFIELRRKAFNSSADSAGRNAKTAYEVYYQDLPPDAAGALPSLADFLGPAGDADETFWFTTTARNVGSGRSGGETDQDMVIPADEWARASPEMRRIWKLLGYRKGAYRAMARVAGPRKSWLQASTPGFTGTYNTATFQRYGAVDTEGDPEVTGVTVSNELE